MSRSIPRHIWLHARHLPRSGLSGDLQLIPKATASAQHCSFSAAASLSPGSGKVPPASCAPQAGQRPVATSRLNFLTPSKMTSKVSHYSTATSSRAKKPPVEPKPSSSIVLLSPTNQVLLLHRVKTSSSFASAHVFPGGNLSEFHDGAVPPPGYPARHEDSLTYRLGAIRETFEESGILLARDATRNDGTLLNLPAVERDSARKRIYNNEIKFGEWLESVGGVPDTNNLHPFTRWITPPATPRRFTTQMYIYMLPLSSAPSTGTSLSGPALAAAESEAAIPTPDGSEVTASVFDDAGAWLARQRRGEVMLFPPQAFLLTLVSQFCGGGGGDDNYQAQRDALLGFLRATPTATHPRAVRHAVSAIPWADKVISPVSALVRGADGRVVLTLERPGPELAGSGRGGDWERVVLVRFANGSSTEVEVRGREEVFEEEREWERRKKEGEDKEAKL